VNLYSMTGVVVVVVVVVVAVVVVVVLYERIKLYALRRTARIRR